MLAEKQKELFLRESGAGAFAGIFPEIESQQREQSGVIAVVDNVSHREEASGVRC
jgi:hypothetical protein